MESIEIKSTLNITAAGAGNEIRFGDIDGDGRMEFIMVQPGKPTDTRYFSAGISCATAFSPDGELLWQIGTPDKSAAAYDGDLPIQIYDIDKDGKNEVIIIINDELLILDGKTAETKKSVPLPDRYACDSITIADLDGSGYAQNIIIKNAFSNLWAYDVNLNILWSFQGNIGRTPAVCDINGDGIEEVIAGSCVLSGTGELLWEAEISGHISSICIQNDEEPIILMAGQYISAYTVAGDLIWQINESAKKITTGHFRDNTSSNDILIVDNLSLFDENGHFLYQKNETVYLPILVNNFDKSEKTYIVGHKKEDVCTTIYDGYMRAIYTLPTFGSIAACDICGNGIPQIIIYNDETMDIYSFYSINLAEAERPYPRQQTKQYYNSSIMNLPALTPATQAYMIDDFASQNILKWAETYANLNIHNSFAKVSRSEFILLLATLLNLKEDFDENFSDVARNAAYYEAAGTFKKHGIIKSDDNMLSPELPITVADANDILEKLSLPLKFNFDEKYEISKQDTARLILSLNSQS